jgi:hypothetical protein
MLADSTEFSLTKRPLQPANERRLQEIRAVPNIDRPE